MLRVAQHDRLFCSTTKTHLPAMRHFLPSLLALLVTLPTQAQSLTPKQLNGHTPFTLGVIDTLQSTVLKEKRALNIYLPAGYQPQDTTRYPVVYLLDGSADEDFIHIAGLMQYMNFPWVNIAPKSIIVGIANIDRRRDFTYPTTNQKDKARWPTTGGSAAFIRFIAQEVQPYIRRTYHAGPRTTLIGQSFGALLATEILFRQPALFTDYIIVSPSLWWDDESLLRLKPAALPAPPRTVYVAVGKEGRQMEEDAQQLTKKIKDQTGPKTQVDFEFFPNEDHATIFHQAVYNAFKARKGSAKKEGK